MTRVAAERRLTVETVPPSTPETSFACGRAPRPDGTAEVALLPLLLRWRGLTALRADLRAARVLPDPRRGRDSGAARGRDRRAVPAGATLVELGSGSAAKTRRLIAALLRRRGTLRYAPIDIARGPLEESARRLLDEFASLEIHALAGEYRDGLRRLDAVRRTDGRDRPAADPVAGIERGQLRAARGRGLPRAGAGDDGTGRPAAGRSRPAQGARRARVGLRRRRGRDRPLQQEPARPHQPGARRPLRPAVVRPPGGLRRGRRPRADVPGVPAGAGGADRSTGAPRPARGRRGHPHRERLQVLLPGDSGSGGGGGTGRWSGQWLDEGRRFSESLLRPGGAAAQRAS